MNFSQRMELLLLPVELIYLVCEQLTLREMSTLSQTCNYFYQHVHQNSFYAFCRESFDTDEKKYVCNLMKHFNYFQQFYLCYSKKYDNYCILEIACVHGHLETAKWLLQHHPTINIRSRDDNIFWGVCLNGHLETAKWLVQIYPEIKNDIFWPFQLAGRNGHLGFIEWLVESFDKSQLHPCVIVTTRESAREHGHVEMTKWLSEKYPC